MGCSVSASTIDSSLEGVKDFHDKFTLGSKLGRGTFAQVRLAREVNSEMDGSTTEDKAVKIIDLRQKSSKDEELNGQIDLAARRMLLTVHSEVTHWKRIKSHPNCVKLHDVYMGTGMCYMVMERCSSDLLGYLQRAPELTERQFGQIFRQMLLSIAHIHSCKVVHRDIKQENFLVGEDGVTVKLCDFGLATLNSAKGNVGVNGTAPFMCPEMLKGLRYDEKADIWSFGVVVYSSLYGKFPYASKEATAKAFKKAIVQGAPVKYEPAGRSSQVISEFRTECAVQFVKSLLARNPKQRPSASELLATEFMVAVEENRHAFGVELPCLQQMVVAAKKHGVFENRNPADEDEIDSTLKKLQREKHGSCISMSPLDSKPQTKKSVCEREADLPSLCASTASPGSMIESLSEGATSSNSSSLFSKSFESQNMAERYVSL